MRTVDVTIRATDTTLNIIVDPGGAEEAEHFDYDAPGTVTGADLVEILAACGIQADYEYTPDPPSGEGGPPYDAATATGMYDRD